MVVSGTEVCLCKITNFSFYGIRTDGGRAPKLPSERTLNSCKAKLAVKENLDDSPELKFRG